MYYRAVRALALTLLVCIGAVPCASAEPHPTSVVPIWIMPGDPRLTRAVRDGLTHSLSARGRTLREQPLLQASEPSLRADLAQALAAYQALELDETLASLTRLSGGAQRLGGGDLDTHALGDLYLHLALAAQELGQSDAAWDALVRAVRIEPTRALDPARVPPRATTAHRRAQLELAQLTGVELELRLPPGGRASIDGDDAHESGNLGRRLVPGPHFVRVDAPGYEPFRGMVVLALPNEIFAPNLRALASAAFEAAPEELAARLDRVPDGWRLRLRGTSVGVRLEAAALVDENNANMVTASLVDRVLGVAPVAPRPVWKRWWLWTAVGIGVAAVAISVPVALSAHSGSTPGSAGGMIVPLR